MNKLSRRLLLLLFLTLAAVATPLPTAASGQKEDNDAPQATIREGMASVGAIARDIKTIDDRLRAIDKSIAGIDALLAQATIREGMASVGAIAGEITTIDDRLQTIEKSIAGIDASLQPVAALTRLEGLRAVLDAAGAQAYAQLRALILLATGCAAGLIALFAVLRRWSTR